MNKFLVCLLTIFVFLGCGSPGHAGEATTRVYKVTSYNLGALVEPDNLEKFRFAQDFSPLLITNSAADIFTSEHKETAGEDSNLANINGFALSATFDATQRISLQGAFGVTRNLWAPDSLNYESESSWEANLGIIYKLLDNLSYELHFGYMDTGDIFTDRSSYTDVENIIMINSKLTMSF